MHQIVVFVLAHTEAKCGNRKRSVLTKNLTSVLDPDEELLVLKCADSKKVELMSSDHLTLIFFTANATEIFLT